MKRIRAAFQAWFAVLFNRYEGATYSSTRSYIPGAVQSARFDAGSSTRTELVRKSRYFEKNDGLVNRMADLFECYTVGTGLQVEPNSSRPEWNQKAKDWWGTWDRFADLTTRQPFGSLQGLIARSWFIDGEVFILLTRGDGGRPRIQLIESHLISTPDNMKDREGVSIIDGVGIDGNGRPTGYYFANDPKENKAKTWRFLPAESVIHVFEQSRPGQYRGLPFVTPVINDIHDLNDLQIFEMQAAKAAAAVTEVIETASGELNMEDLRRVGISAASTTAGGSGTTTNQYYEDVFGASAKVIKSGDKYSQHVSNRPTVTQQWYWRYRTEVICAGVGIPYVIVFPDSMQGTVYRGALDMANAFFRARFAVIAEVCRRVWEYTMGWASKNEPMLAGAPDDWWRVSISPPRAVNVDVGRNSAAMIAELAVGATDYELIYSPLGLDWRERFDKLKEQKDYADSIGLELSPKQSAQKEPQV